MITKFETAGAELGTFCPILINLWGSSQYKVILGPRKFGTFEAERKLLDKALSTSNGNRAMLPKFKVFDSSGLRVACFVVPSRIPEVGTGRTGAPIMWGCAFPKSRLWGVGRDPAAVFELVWAHLSGVFSENSALAFPDKIQILVNKVLEGTSGAADETDSFLLPIVRHYDGLAKLTVLRKEYVLGLPSRPIGSRAIVKALEREVGNPREWKLPHLVHMCGSAWRSVGFQPNFEVECELSQSDELSPIFRLRGKPVALAASV